MNRCTVPHAVRMKSLASERGHTQRRVPNVLLEDEAHTKSSQWLAAMIEEDAACFVQGNPTLFQMQTQRSGRFSPQRATAFLVALATRVKALWGVPPESVDAQ